MTDSRSPDRRPLLGPEGPADPDREVRELLRSAGPRLEMRPEDLDIVKRAARGEWRRLVDERPPKRGWSRRPLLAAAAAAVAAVGLAWWLLAAGGPPESVAVVEVLDGSGALAGSDPLELGDPVLDGASIAVPVGGRPLGLRWRDGRSVRLAPGSRMTVASPWRLELTVGSLYVDTPPSVAPGRPFTVATPAGLVVERGTQFEVNLATVGAPLRVRVREGVVEVDTAGGDVAVTAGQQWVLGPDGEGSIESVDPWDDSWSWVLRAAPTPTVEGSDLASFLEEECREAGWRLVWESAELAAEAATVELHGSVDGMTPDQAVAVILAGSRLDYRLEEGRLFVGNAGAGP